MDREANDLSGELINDNERLRTECAVQIDRALHSRVLV